MNSLDLSKLTNEELEQRLYEEFRLYDWDLKKLCHIIRKQLPRKMVYRIISKLFRMRVNATNTILKKHSHYKCCERNNGDKCEEPHCLYSSCVLSTDHRKQVSFVIRMENKMSKFNKLLYEERKEFYERYPDRFIEFLTGIKLSWFERYKLRVKCRIQRKLEEMMWKSIVRKCVRKGS